MTSINILRIIFYVWLAIQAVESLEKRLTLLDVALANEGFEEVVVGVVERYVDVGTVGNTTHRVHQQKTTILANGRTIGRGGERLNHLVGSGAIHLIAGVGVHLIECRSQNCCGRNITRLVGDVGSVEVPVGHQVLGHIVVVQHKACNLLCVVEVTLVAREAVAYGVAINSPSLTTSPSRIIRRTLCGATPTNVAVLFEVVVILLCV